MVYICEDFSEEHDVIFNAKKTLGMCYGPTHSTDIRNIYLNRIPIVWKSSAKYLGNMLSHDRSDAEDIKFKKGSFITAVNKLNYAFRDIDSFTKIKLFQTYCTAWYGCQSW